LIVLTPPALPKLLDIEDIVGTSLIGLHYSVVQQVMLLDMLLVQQEIIKSYPREFNMSSTTADPILCFNLKQAPYSTPPRCEVVRVFIKIGAGDWTQLVEYNYTLANYTYQNVT
jgi:hypothetical protein